MKYTLVQHTGWSVGGNPQFQRAVEELAVDGRQAKAVERAGGVVFDSYGAAADAQYKENYPPEVGGLIPGVRGKFSARKIEGSRIYIPAVEGG